MNSHLLLLLLLLLYTLRGAAQCRAGPLNRWRNSRTPSRVSSEACCEASVWRERAALPWEADSAALELVVGAVLGTLSVAAAADGCCATRCAAACAVAGPKSCANGAADATRCEVAVVSAPLQSKGAHRHTFKGLTRWISCASRAASARAAVSRAVAMGFKWCRRWWAKVQKGRGSARECGGGSAVCAGCCSVCAVRRCAYVEWPGHRGCSQGVLRLTWRESGGCRAGQRLVGVSALCRGVHTVPQEEYEQSCSEWRPARSW